MQLLLNGVRLGFDWCLGQGEGIALRKTTSQAQHFVGLEITYKVCATVCNGIKERFFSPKWV
jgi:hypothetical protein